MELSPGPSEPKKRKVIKTENLDIDIDIKEEVCSDDSADDFDLMVQDSSEDSDQEIQDSEPDIPSYFITLEVPTQSTFTSSWTTTGELQDIKFSNQKQFLPSLGHTPIDYLNFFFDEDLLNMICKRTNEQAARLVYIIGHKTRIGYWKQLANVELRVFLGLLFHMGTLPMPRLQDYWKTSRLFSIPIFAQSMSKNRFLMILRCLHFSPEAENETDPLLSIRSVFDHFNDKMAKFYCPGRELIIDEDIYVKKRCKIQVNKNLKDEIKLLRLSEPDGLFLKMQVDAESKEKTDPEAERAEIMSILEEKLDCGHAVYIDGNYNSCELAKTLLQRNTYCTGLLRVTLKDNPSAVVRKSLTKDENISRFFEGIHVGKWRHHRLVTYITTQFQDRKVPFSYKRGKNGPQMWKKPEAVAIYDEMMSLTDRQEQILTHYPLEKNSLRWYLKLAIHTFQIMLLNSFKLYSKFSGQPEMTFYKYRLSVIDDLLPKPDSKTDERVRNPHRLTRIREKYDNGKTKRRVCRQCSKSKKRQESIWSCEACTERPGLCVECFDSYHAALKEN